MKLEVGKMEFFPTSGAKGVRDVDPTCRCRQCNIIPDSILLHRTVYKLGLNLCVCFLFYLGAIFSVSLIRKDKVFNFITITLVAIGKL